MKIYAKTLSPEDFDYQFYVGDIDESIIIDGGREFGGVHADILEDIVEGLTNFNQYDLETEYGGLIREYLNDLLPKKDNGQDLTQAEADRIFGMLASYNDIAHPEIIAVCLSVIKGIEYDYHTFWGVMQSEHAIMYAPTSTERSVIQYAEAVYFGTGTEVLVDESETDDPIEPEDMQGPCFYTANYDIKKEIADMYGLSPADIVLYEFDGYIKTPKYKLAE